MHANLVLWHAAAWPPPTTEESAVLLSLLVLVLLERGHSLWGWILMPRRWLSASDVPHFRLCRPKPQKKRSFVACVDKRWRVGRLECAEDSDA